MYKDRIKTLREISSLTVKQRKDKLTGELIFEFIGENGICLKSVYTYRKAKVFAEGVRVGRSIHLYRSNPQPCIEQN